MSNKYKRPEDVPNEVLATRLDQLAEFVVKYANDLPSEFSMRVPVECDRDADVVLSVSARRLRALSPVVMPEDVEEALRWMKETDECVRESMPGTLDGHALNLAGYIRSLSSPAPVEGKIGTVHWDCLYCKQRLNKFNSADCDTFCCGNHECHSFGKAQWVVATDRGIHEGDKTVAVTVRANPDGSQTVTDIREIVDSRARLSRLEREAKGEG